MLFHENYEKFSRLGGLLKQAVNGSFSDTWRQEKLRRLFIQKKYAHHKRLLKNRIIRTNELKKSDTLLSSFEHTRSLDRPENTELLASRFQACSLPLLKDMLDFHTLYGDLEIAFIIREQYLIKLLNPSKKSEESTAHFRALLEVGEYEKAVNKFELYKRRQKQTDIKEAIAFAYYILGETESAAKLRHSFLGFHDISKCRQLSERDISVLGPAPLALDCSAELTFSENIAIINPLSREKISQLQYSSIYAYFSQAITKARTSDIRKMLPLFKCASFRTKELKDHVAKGYAGDTPLRIRFHPASLMLNERGGPNQIQNIVYDLTFLNMKSIKLYGTTFFASPALYTPDYRETDLAVADRSLSIRIHEPFSNFAFIKNMYTRGKLQVDRVTSAVLNLSKHEYASALKQRYAPPF
jgi:tetratricopeptide (TPR) repeat protein